MTSTNKYKLRVLFVDDEASIAEMMAEDLPRMGHDTVVCRDARSAIETLKTQKFDAAIVDLRMPGGSGWEVVDFIREIEADTEIVISTGHGDLDDAIRAIRLGAYDFLPKPTSLFEILATLDRIGEKRSLENHAQALESRLERAEGPQQLIGESPPMLRVKRLIEKIAPTDSAVLIMGETGTGKEVVARSIHDLSERADAPFVPVNCGAIPEHLVESEFFGHKKGAFTGADTARKGLFEVANGGTLFLDELGELDKGMQVKLLRFLESGEVRPVGDNSSFKVDVRIVCATNRDLQQMVAEGSFREDLFFRVNTFEIHLPPLRERDGDLLLLARHLMARYLKRPTVPQNFLSPEAIAVLEKHDWTGNIRELANALEHAVIISDGVTIQADDLPRSISRQLVDDEDDHLSFAGKTLTLRDMEKSMILHVLEKHDGDKPAAAKELGIALKTLYNRLNQYEAVKDAG